MKYSRLCVLHLKCRKSCLQLRQEYNIYISVCSFKRAKLDSDEQKEKTSKQIFTSGFARRTEMRKCLRSSVTKTNNVKKVQKRMLTSYFVHKVIISAEIFAYFKLYKFYNSKRIQLDKSRKNMLLKEIAFYIFLI